MIEVVAVPLVDRAAEGARAHEPVELLVVEEERGAAQGLVGVVPAHHSLAPLRVVGSADAREQQQPHVAEDVGGEQHEIGGLLELAARLVHVGHARGPARARVEVHPQDVRVRDELEALALRRAGRMVVWGAGLRLHLAAEALAEAAVHAGVEAEAVGVRVRPRHVRRGHRERFAAQLSRGLVEERAHEGRLHRRVRVLPRPRPLEGVAALLDLPGQVPRLAADAVERARSGRSAARARRR